MRPTPARILYVHHRPERSGASGALALLLSRLDRRRYEPHVYCPEGPAAELFRPLAHVHPGSVALFTHVWASTYDGLRWLLLGRELARLPSHVATLERALRQGSFDLVHLNDSPLLPAAWVARRAGLPVVWHLRSALPEGPSGRSRLVRRGVRRFADAAIAINADVASSWGVAADVVHDSVDLERFRPGNRAAAKRALGLPEDRPVVSSFGYLYGAKGYRELLQAAAILRRRGLDAGYVLAGGAVRPSSFFRSPAGRLLERGGLAEDHERVARELVRGLGLDASVRLLPRLLDTAPAYAASDVVVAPSQGPEVGLPPIEAAASGIPAVVTGSRDGGGVVLDGRTGLIARDRSPEALAEAIGGLLADPGRRELLGRAARAHAEQEFDPARNARRVEEVYDRLLNGAASRTG